MFTDNRSHQKRGNSGRSSKTPQLINQPADSNTTSQNYPGSHNYPLRVGRNDTQFEEQAPEPTMLCVECPYCDGDNLVRLSGSDPGVFTSEDREIACGYCQSLFRLLECKRAHTLI
jgi:hypothetical protein